MKGDYHNSLSPTVFFRFFSQPYLFKKCESENAPANKTTISNLVLYLVNVFSIFDIISTFVLDLFIFDHSKEHFLKIY